MIPIRLRATLSRMARQSLFSTRLLFLEDKIPSTKPIIDTTITRGASKIKISDSSKLASLPRPSINNTATYSTAHMPITLDAFNIFIIIGRLMKLFLSLLESDLAATNGKSPGLVWNRPVCRIIINSCWPRFNVRCGLLRRKESAHAPHQQHCAVVGELLLIAPGQCPYRLRV